MKSVLKNNLFYFCLGALIFGSIGVYAAGKLLASDISFSPNSSNWDVATVEDAINDLYIIKSNGYEYLDGYTGVDYISSNSGGTPTVPTITESGNVATMKCTDVSNAQGTAYIKIDDISKYKSISVIVSGTTKALNFGLFSKLENKYDYDIRVDLRLYTSSIFTLKNELYTIDVSDLTGSYYLGIQNTYTNITVTTIGMLK